MAVHDTNLHRQTTDLYAHVRIAYAEGLAGMPFSKPYRTPFRSQLWAQEQAYAAWMDGRDAREEQAKRRAAQNLEEIKLGAVDRAAAKQPHAFKEFPGPTPTPPAGAGATTPRPLSGVVAPERNSL